VCVTCIFSFIAGEGDMHPTGSQLQHIFLVMNRKKRLGWTLRFRVMLNGVSGYLLSILKKEIKKRFNIGKVTFYIFKVLNAHISKQIFYFNMFNYCLGVLFSIFLRFITMTLFFLYKLRAFRLQQMRKHSNYVGISKQSYHEPITHNNIYKYKKKIWELAKLMKAPLRNHGKKFY
jgi:hypothetical protein